MLAQRGVSTRSTALLGGVFAQSSRAATVMGTSSMRAFSVSVRALGEGASKLSF